jgi:hypothetical protein
MTTHVNRIARPWEIISRTGEAPWSGVLRRSAHRRAARIVQCLLTHKKDLSKTCRELFTRLGVTR